MFMYIGRREESEGRFLPKSCLFLSSPFHERETVLQENARLSEDTHGEQGAEHMDSDRQERLAGINEKLRDVILRHMETPGARPSAVEGLTLVRREESNSSERCFEKPLASVILQGIKKSTIGLQEYELRENQCLVSAVDMPSMSYAVAPTPQKPFLSLFFYLDRKMLAELISEMEPEERPAFCWERGVSVADAEPDFLEALLRLAELLDKPKQIAVRAPIIMRELHYLLLVGPQGSTLQRLYTGGSQNSQIIQAIAIMKQNISRPLRMETLARQVSMSLSSLHRHFKSVTGFSPLQYHKQLRLYEAQRLMLMENERAANAAMAVGYESVTQFNREYKRMFGEPPHRDITLRRSYAG